MNHLYLRNLLNVADWKTAPACKTLLGAAFIITTMLPATLTIAGSGSLAANMYASRRARETGDLITVIIDEAVSASKNTEMETSKSINASASPARFGPEDGTDTSNMILSDAIKFPGYSAEASSGYEGSGARSSSEQFNARFTARVVDSHTNGVLVIRGERKVMLNGEKINMVLTGMVRQTDITNDNTVASSKISDAHIYYESSGEISRGSKPGWLWRAFQFVNPF